MPEFDRIFTIKNTGEDIEQPETKRLREVFEADQPVFELRLFGESHIGTKSTATLYTIGLNEEGAEEIINEWDFRGFEIGDNLIIRGREHELMTRGKVIDAPGFAPPGVEQAVDVRLEPGIPAVTAGEIAEYSPLTMPASEATTSKKFWCRVVETSLTETFALEGETKSREERMSLAVRYDASITTRKQIEDDKGAAWDISGIEILGRNQDMVLDCVKI